MEENESGFIEEVKISDRLSNTITDIEVLRETQVNVLACGRRHGRMWVLKGLSPELRDSTTGLHRLMKEFEIHSRLCNPAVVQAVDVEEVEGLGPCIVMEWVEGKVLSDMLAEGKIAKHERKRIMREIILAAEYLHRNGVVHRDLKPSNIMVRDAGREVVIIDFGLADTDSYTELKQSAGTQGFISPEQLEKGGADPADDVYSLGVIMNELCPENRKTARLCTGPRASRPADAGELLKFMDLRERRRKWLWRGVSLACIIALACGAVWILSGRLRRLDESSIQSGLKIDSLMAVNKQNADYVTLLSDSLNNISGSYNNISDSLVSVHDRMVNAEEELSRTKAQAELYERIQAEGIKRIANILQRYDRKEFANDSLEIYEKPPIISKLNSEVYDEIRKYCDNMAGSGLTSSELLRLNSEMNNFYIAEFQKYYNKWMGKLIQI